MPLHATCTGEHPCTLLGTPSTTGPSASLLFSLAPLQADVGWLLPSPLTLCLFLCGESSSPDPSPSPSAVGMASPPLPLPSTGVLHEAPWANTEWELRVVCERIKVKSDAVRGVQTVPPKSYPSCILHRPVTKLAQKCTFHVPLARASPSAPHHRAANH